MFNICLQEDDVQDFDARWSHILLGTSEMPPEKVLQGFCRNRLQGSEQQKMARRNRESKQENWSRIKKKGKKVSVERNVPAFS